MLDGAFSSVWFVAALVLAVIYFLLRHRLQNAADARSSIFSQSKGWVRGDARLSDALDVARRHLSNARSGSNVRLQYGQIGCLTLLRKVDRSRATAFVLRWEFWRPNPDLAKRLMSFSALALERPKQDTLELTFEGDYLAFEQAVGAAFETEDIVVGNMHLTWNC